MHFVQNLTVTGNVVAVEAGGVGFDLVAGGGKRFKILVDPTTSFDVLKNLDGMSRNSVPDPEPVPGEISQALLTSLSVSLGGAGFCVV
ncbi:hypothetical protein EON77_17075, partial [bacterium]